MGRVDEAMRRAAETAALGSAVPGGVREDGSMEAARAVRAVPLDATYPSETAERARVHVFAPSATPPPEERATTDAALLPPVSDRIDARFHHKVVVDQAIDPRPREQYRRLAAGLHAVQAQSGCKAILVASAVAGEGKSLTSSNLALTLSESYRRNVLLIDADLRRPTLHTVFGLDPSPGLSDGLLAGEDRRLRLHRVSAHLTILTAGQPTNEPMAVLSSERMRRLLAEGREMFDWVIIDTPPIGVLSDASLLSQIADGAVLVVKAGATPYDQVQRAVDAIGKARVLGVVLNRAEAADSSAYKYEGYDPSPGAASIAREV
jgi:protein-tyrosine kinase